MSQDVQTAERREEASTTFLAPEGHNASVCISLSLILQDRLFSGMKHLHSIEIHIYFEEVQIKLSCGTV